LFPLQKPSQFRTLLSPVRFEVFEAMRVIAPCSILELSVYLNRRADSLYQHVKRLQSIGVVVPAEVRKRGRHTEQVYDLAADDVEFGTLRGSEADRVIAQTAKLFLSVARKTLRDALAARALRYEPGERNVIIINNLAWLTRDDYERVRGLTREIVATLDAARRRRQGELYMCMNLVSPVVRRRRGGAASRKPAD
jgi:hypothetical protein